MKNELMNSTNENLMDPFLGFFAPEFNALGRGNDCLSMKTDIKDDGKNYVLDVDLPGIDKKDIAVSLEQGYLTIRAQANRDSSEKDKKGNYLHRERFNGTASRSYYVGDIDEKLVEANYTNGVLTIILPKEEEKKAALEHKILVK